MKNLLRLSLVLALFITISCKNDAKENDVTNDVDATKEIPTNTREVAKDVDKDKTLTVDLLPKNDSTATGKVIFSENDGIITILASIKGLSEGEHVMYINNKADYSSPNDKWGDIGNFTVNKNGRGTLAMTTDEWCISCSDDTKDIMGKTIIVYQPSGDEDSRVSCTGSIE